MIDVLKHAHHVTALPMDSCVKAESGSTPLSSQTMRSGALWCEDMSDRQADESV